MDPGKKGLYVIKMSQERLETLFRACDKKGTGFVDSQDFRELCASFEIDEEDADAIFSDLDHDGDSKISFEDFAFGFRDFLMPGAKRGSVQLGLSPTLNSTSTTTQPSQSMKQRSQKYLSSGSKEPTCEVINEEFTMFTKQQERKNEADKDDYASSRRNAYSGRGGISQTAPMTANMEVEAKQKQMEAKHRAAEGAWRHFTHNVGSNDVNKFLDSRLVSDT